MMRDAAFLDRSVPLDGASHANVVDYEVVVPMRYAECIATLEDGTRVRFRNPRQFVGWSGPADQRRYLFRDGDRGIEIRTNTARRRHIREILEAARLKVIGSADAIAELRPSSCTSSRKVVARDGSLIFTQLVMPAYATLT